MKTLRVNRALQAIVVASAFLAASLGCEPSQTESKLSPVAPGDPGLASRLAAASAIVSSVDRDSALAKVAADAAQAGDAVVVKTALEQIGSTGVRDSTAAEAARRLATAGKGADAVEVARSIGSTSVRDETLKAIATNE